MQSSEYQAYMASPRWAILSDTTKKRWKHRCYVCGERWQDLPGVHLTTHHLRYFRNGESILGKERPSDLVPLCSRHHLRGKLGLQTLKIMRWQYRIMRLLYWPFRLALALLRR